MPLSECARLNFIICVLKDSLKQWGWNPQFLNRSLLQAFVCIAIVGGLGELIGQLADLPSFYFFSSISWHQVFSWPSLSIIFYLLFVIIEGWLKRGGAVLSLQTGLEDGLYYRICYGRRR